MFNILGYLIVRFDWFIRSINMYDIVYLEASEASAAMTNAEG